MSLGPFASATLGAALAVMASLGSVAAADDKVVLGGGAGIIVAGNNCTLTTIGHDKSGELVGFTAGHCGGPGAPVEAEGAAVGTVASADGDYYEIIKFDPAKVNPVSNYGGFAINGVSGDPNPGDTVCKDGAATGPDCVPIKPFLDSTPDRPISRMHVGAYQPGDDGGPVTSNGLLVGMIYNGFATLATGPFIVGHGSQPQIRVHYISAILGDVNAKGGLGAGFSPI
jgi:hypothetical protein